MSKPFNLVNRAFELRIQNTHHINVCGEPDFDAVSELAQVLEGMSPIELVKFEAGVGLRDACPF